MPTQEYTISHTGSVLDDETTTNVQRHQNQSDPRRETPVLEFTCPQNFDRISYVGARDPTRFVPRTMETFTGDGATTTFTLNARIQPVAGEPDLDEQDHPAVVAVDVGAGNEVAIESIDYATGDVTLAAAPADGNSVKLYPILTEGTMKFRGIDTLGHVVGPVDSWGFPVYRFFDFHQDKRGQELNLDGSVSWTRHETVEVMLDSPHQIVWEDADFPGSYVSTFEQDVQITY